jgi:zinc dependent phospholipase C
MKHGAVITGIFLLAVVTCDAYSALSHEAIVDSAWESHIKPLLLQRYPNATPEELKEAHAYVYGGCLIQDLGYYPFSSHLFSDLTHYVRSGDYVMNLIRDAENLNDFAFALGALAHYTSDHVGHPAVNRSVALIYPKLRAKFGDQVTYEDNRGDHLKTEFGFDVIQVGRQLYAPDAYHDFIGFKVSKPVLERAFHDTYGIEMKEIFSALDLGIGTYRFTMARLIPSATQAAWNSKRDDIKKLSPGIVRSKYIYALPRRKYHAEWGKEYQGPGFFARFLTVIFKIIPTFGPFKVFGFKPVPDRAEQDFLKSFEATTDEYRRSLAEVRAGRVNLPNYNLDTGKPSQPGDYKLADEAYAQLVHKLAEHQFSDITPDVRADVLAYFNKADRTTITLQTLQEIELLQAK